MVKRVEELKWLRAWSMEHGERKPEKMKVNGLMNCCSKQKLYPPAKPVLNGRAGIV
jgi:hypothetical protein